MVLSNSSTPGAAERDVLENALVAVVILLLLLASVIGNLAVLVAVYTNRHLRDELSSVFIVNLSFTDLASALTVILTSFVAVCADYWPMGQVVCDIVCMANYCFIIVSMLTLSFISVDRYIAVVRPLCYHRMVNKTKVHLMIAYSWFQGMAFSVVPVIYRWVKYDYWEGTCAIQWHQQRDQTLRYVITAFVVCFLFPSIILVVCYSQVVKTAKSTIIMIAPVTYSDHGQGDIPDQGHGQGQSMKYTTSYKAIYGLLVVVVAFFVCMAPFSVTKLYKVSVSHDNVLKNYVSLVSSVIAYMSSALNPLIYGIFRKDFRTAFKLLFIKLTKRVM